jgi:hypothetical protein
VQRPDIALVSLATTPGLVRSDEAFAGLVRAAGATCETIRVRIGRAGALRRHIAVTDLVEALAARRSARGIDARAIVYSTVTASFFQRPSVPYAVRFDATAALNRPVGWQRMVERRTLTRARLLLPLTDAAAVPHPRSVVLPIPIEPISGAGERDIDAVAYAGYPRKRGLELLCAAWAAAAPAGARLVVGGLDRAKALRWLDRCGVPEPRGVEWAGALPRERWLELVARARLFVNASRWEDFGIAPLEALSAGALLVTVPTPGPFAALPIARTLDPSLVASDTSADALGQSLRAGLAAERGDYPQRAEAALEPFRPARLVEVVRAKVLPALL